MTTAPYSSHTAVNSAVDGAIRNETGTGAITPAKVADAIEKSAAMVGAIVKRTLAGVVSYHAPATRSGSDADNALWFDELETLLDTASEGDTYSLPPVVFQPGTGDASVIEIIAPNVTVYGNGCTIKRGANTPKVDTSSYLFKTSTAAQNLIVKDVIFDGDGTGSSGTLNTVYTAATATFVNCRFNDPLDTGESYSLKHVPSKTTSDAITLVDCVFNDAGQGCFRAMHGVLRVYGGELNILSDRNGTGSGNPYQRFFQFDANSGFHPKEAYLEGVRMTCAAPDVEDANMGYFNFGGDEEADDTTGIHAAISDDGSAIDTSAGFTDPEDRGEPGYSDAAPCRVSITVLAGSATEADINSVTHTVTGTDANGNALSEIFPPCKVNQEGTQEGRNFFKTVTRLESSAAHAATGVTTSVGWVTPRIEQVVMRDCTIHYDEINFGSSGQFAKMESVESTLLEGVTITHTQHAASHTPLLRTDDECDSFTMRNCVMPGLFAPLGGRLRNLTIDGCRLGMQGHAGATYMMQNARFAKHINIRNSRFDGAVSYFFGTNGSTPWDRYDEEATITMRNVEYTFNDVGSNYMLDYIPRLGFFAATGLRDMQAPDAPTDYEGDVFLADSVAERLMATVHPDNRHVAFLGRRLDFPDVLAGLVASAAGSHQHPFAVAVSDTGDSAFTSVAASEGDIIWNDYGGKNDISGPSDSDVLAWRYSSTGKWWPILAAETDPPAP